MKYFFPIHLDGGNRGCEAIAKGTALLLEEKPENLVAYCRDVELDQRLEVGHYVQLVPCRRESLLVDKFLALINKIFRTTCTRRWRLLYPYRSFLKLIHAGDVMISTGGDMMCYDDNEVIFTNDKLHKRGVKTILWGCSMGPENLTPAKKRTLFNFSLIYARESLTYDFFKQLGLKHVCLCPDPAFILPAEPCPLPHALLGGAKVVGINISNYVTGNMGLDNRFGEEVKSLLSFILKETDLHILLVPHVTWNAGSVNQDDRQMCRIISDSFGQVERISVLDIDGLNYCQIRHVISKCSFFIGARTHAVISAYSMCVPTIALGYSIKSRGIAKDLGLDERLIVNSKKIEQGALCNSFKYMLSEEETIRRQLSERMPSYKEQTYQVRAYVKDFVKK
ncbi:MAG: polysaccharide pyruvyl transferase family protein [Bacteroidales bacterium]|nr:polysaccharide pyruvyl transferase family protein [Candidatus Physcousia equi]